MLVLSGCYTVLLHQSVTLSDSEEMTEQDGMDEEDISHGSACYSCHTDEFPAYDYAWYQMNSAYDRSAQHYYFQNDRPWWVGNLVPDTTGDDGNVGEDQTSRNYGRRRTSINENASSGSLFNSSSTYVSGGSSSVGTFVSPSLIVPKDTSATAKGDSAAGSSMRESKTDNQKRTYGTRKTVKKKE